MVMPVFCEDASLEKARYQAQFLEPVVSSGNRVVLGKR